MAMHDNILIDIQLGLIPARFFPDDLLGRPCVAGSRYLIGNSSYALSSIKTNLNNLRVGPDDQVGNHVYNGRPAIYRKFDDGSFELMGAEDLRHHYVNVNTSVSEVDAPISVNHLPVIIESTDKSYIYNAIIDYIACKPFQIQRRGGFYPAFGPVNGWLNRLHAYNWRGQDWESTCRTVSQIVSDIETMWHLPAEERLHHALMMYNRIKEWGNPRGAQRDAEDLYISMANVRNGCYGDGLRIDSTATKLYAFTRPEAFVIYDSRVATAIISIVEDLYRQSDITQFRNFFPNIGHMNSAAAAGTRPRVTRYKQWPNAYQSWAAQLEANELCCGIRDYLNNRAMDGKDDWTLREVEAVLFMEGY